MRRCSLLLLLFVLMTVPTVSQAQFTEPGSAVHLPSVVASARALTEKGIDDVVILCVSDPFVMRAWGD